MEISLSKLCEMVKDREAWYAAVYGITKSQHDRTNEQQRTKSQDDNKKINFVCFATFPTFPKYNQTINGKDYPGGSDGKASASNAGDPGSISALGRPPGEENGNPLQYSCLKNSMDKGAWQATVHSVPKSWT